jgi:hypothetical protein
MVVRNFSLLPNAPSIINRELFHDCLRDVESHLAYVRCQTTTMLYPITYSDDVTSEKEASLLQPIQSLNCISLMLSMTCDTWNSSIDQRVFVLARLRVFTSVLVSGFNEDFWSISSVLQLPTLPNYFNSY